MTASTYGIVGLQKSKPHWKVLLAVSMKLIILPINPEIVLLTFMKLIWKVHSRTKVNKRIFVTALFIVIKNWKWPRCPFTGWRHKLQHIHEWNVIQHLKVIRYWVWEDKRVFIFQCKKNCSERDCVLWFQLWVILGNRKLLLSWRDKRFPDWDGRNREHGVMLCSAAVLWQWICHAPCVEVRGHSESLLCLSPLHTSG